MESLEIDVPLVNKDSKETIEQSSINTNSNIIRAISKMEKIFLFIVFVMLPHL